MKTIPFLHALIALLLALVAGPVAAENEVLRYTVLMSDDAKGELSVERVEPNLRRVVYSFRDRGRGPDLVTVTRTDDRGIPTLLTVSGTDYRHMTVEERFEVTATQARWTSDADQGEASVGGYYLPQQSNAENMAALARALLSAPERRLALLPGGEARIEHVERPRLSDDVTPDLYFIRGVSMQPIALWLDAQGELFASGSSWIGLIRKGHEAIWPALVAAQERALASDARDRAGKLGRKPDGPLLIRGALMFDAERRRMMPGMSVLSEGDRIIAVAPDDEMATPPHAEVINANGKALLPGLWDMHVHVLGQADGLLALMAGITTVRDLGNDPDTLDLLAAEFDTGTLPGPHVLKAGLIDGPGEYAGPTKMLVDDPGAMRAAIAHYANRGYPMIKLYSSLDPALVPVAVEAAHRRGLRVGGHVPAGMLVTEALKAGFDEIQHGNFWLLNFMGPEVLSKTHTPVRFSAAYEHGHKIDPDGEAVRDFVAKVRDSGAAVDPTLVTFEHMFTAWKGEIAAPMSAWTERLPAQSLRRAKSGGRATTPAELHAYRESFRRMQQILLRLHNAGVPVLVGTDGSGLLYARELELHVAAGLDPVDALYNATLGAARIMGHDVEAGRIAPGQRADLVLVDGNPARRIADIRKTDLVVKQGIIYDPAALAEAAGLRPAGGGN